LLAYIIEKVSGMDYLTYLNEEIFNKAGMSLTFSRADLPPAAAKGYASLISLWERILSNAGDYLASNTYERIENPGHTDY
jgi:CubicO group peptidase (beta-lactamase class C family)